MYRQIDMDPPNVVTNGIAQNQTTPGAANILLNGSQVTAGVWDIYGASAGYSDGIGGARVAFVSVGDISAVVFTITGTDQDGIARTETVTGVTTSPVNSVIYWRTITSIAAGAAVASNVAVGAISQIVSPTIPVNWRNNQPAAFTVVSLLGTVQFDLQQTLSELLPATDPTTLLWYDAQSNKTAEIAGEFTRYVTACRVRWDSYSSGAEFQFQVREQDYNPY